ncbi:MAG: alpha/beta fold hydrolase [Armatimonadetes bacterium]|nr:alpha/beta fold hydrolase [Armatimonadota bacterium]
MQAAANGITLYYEQEGAGPDLLLIPGLGGSTHVWYAQSKGLSPVLRVTTVDPRGHGQSEKPSGPYSIPMLAADMAALIHTAGIAPAIVVGSSMSAMTAVQLAAEQPELVSAVVLVGGFPMLGPPGKERMEGRARTAEGEGMGPLADLVASTALGAHTHRTQPALVGLFRAALLANDPQAYAASCRAIVEADVTPQLARVHQPTLILLGSEEQVAPLPAARALKAGIPHAEFVVLPQAGHLPFLEQPAAFNAALQEFVGRLPA